MTPIQKTDQMFLFTSFEDFLQNDLTVDANDYLTVDGDGEVG
jgi:hypothetical protein